VVVAEAEVVWAAVVACSASKTWMAVTATVAKGVAPRGAQRKITILKMSPLMVELIVQMPSQTFQRHRGCNMALEVVLAHQSRGFVVAF
jgi:Na+/phosphate symporter